ncbi:transcription factor bHLH96-like [Senna tora]|uniref:Transcription factor bHLH96-like n=1 Tax=Senna tora TaxID=362788 RepID=A0A834WSJ3_9FABA|nr:transcription factor bHLH96-like [Senna tora]
MALEAVVFPQDPFSYSFKDLYSLLGGGWSEEEAKLEEKGMVGIGIKNNKREHSTTTSSVHASWDYYSCSSATSNSVLQNVKEPWDYNSNSSPEACTLYPSASAPSSTGRRKRRRTKNAKNKEEIENQRMTHIAVERNRRRQMNDYLAVLRSLMPPSYVQRASIIGGAINFVKELEQLLQSMEAQTQNKSNETAFAHFFTFPQYTTTSAAQSCTATNDAVQKESGVADIEVSLVDSHANLKILSNKQPGQLLKMVLGLQTLRLCILHLNVTTTLDNMVLYSLSVKVEEGCQLSTVDEIADAVNQLLRRIQEEACFS